MQKPDEVTLLLQQWVAGSRDALARVLQLVYPEFQSLAGRRMRSQRVGHTLQPTALVNEVCLRLIKTDHVDWKSRQHFFAVSARMMDRVLVDYERRRRAGRRISPDLRLPVDIGELNLPSRPYIDFDEVADALDRLTTLSPRQANVARYRFFAGMTFEEIAAELGVSDRTAKEDWSVARAWLAVSLSEAQACSIPSQPADREGKRPAGVRPVSHVG